VACREWPESEWNVWVMQPDGGEPAFLHAGREPAWLEAKTVLFVAPASAEPGARLAVWAMRLDGSGLRLVVRDPQADCLQPAVSRDGRRLAFVKERGGAPETRDVWLCELADGRQTELTMNPSRDDLPRFGADDKHVYFRSTRGGDWGVWGLPVAAAAAAVPATPESAGGAAAGQ
jgi:Tol biopolymer transport system component